MMPSRSISLFAGLNAHPSHPTFPFKVLTRSWKVLPIRKTVIKHSQATYQEVENVVITGTKEKLDLLAAQLILIRNTDKMPRQGEHNASK
jgi:hypothetical protein